MVLGLSLVLMSSDFLRFFTENRDIDGWQDTAFSWVIEAILISVVGAGIMLTVKWLRKRTAAVITQKAWSRNATIVFIVIGLAPVLVLALVFYYASRDFANVVGVSGLAKGVVFAWLLYTMWMLAGHLGPWRRDIF
jgi:hypothetical protein